MAVGGAVDALITSGSCGRVRMKVCTSRRICSSADSTTPAWSQAVKNRARSVWWRLALEGGLPSRPHGLGLHASPDSAEKGEEPRRTSHEALHHLRSGGSLQTPPPPARHREALDTETNSSRERGRGLSSPCRRSLVGELGASLGKPLGALEAQGVPEVGAREDGAREVGAREVGVVELGAPEAGAPKAGVPE